MPAKITLTGFLKKMKIIKNPIRPNQSNWNMYEMEESGSPAPPKGLPLASKVHYTVIMNDRQHKKFHQELEENNLSWRDTKVAIIGEITLDIAANIIEGEIGIIPMQIQIIELQKARNQQQEENTNS